MSKQPYVYLLLWQLTGCQEQATAPMSNWLSDGEDKTHATYQQVTPDVELQLPQDHQSHPNFRHEWWYFTANLTDDQGQAFGVQWTQFRIALSPYQSNRASHWSSNQLYLAHSAVTTPTTHLADERWAREHPTLAAVTTNPFAVFIDDWRWQSKTRDLFPATLAVTTPTFRYQLDITRSAPYQKQGINGFSQKSQDATVASFYYNQPFIKVNGTLTINGKTRQVTGDGWMDREWSSQFLQQSQQGWDWFALRLNEELSLVVFQLRETKTNALNYRYGRLMHKNGDFTTLLPEQIKLTPTQQTTIDGKQYPTSWQLSIAPFAIALEISAINPNAKMPLTIPYWEGPVEIKGSHLGQGYMELTGY